MIYDNEKALNVVFARVKVISFLKDRKTKICNFRISYSIKQDKIKKGGDPAAGSPTATL